ncbi:MAG: hypothetical protein AAFY15_11860 [Cyanobacteria bacterium J06648_11]
MSFRIDRSTCERLILSGEFSRSRSPLSLLWCQFCIHVNAH